MLVSDNLKSYQRALSQACSTKSKYTPSTGRLRIGELVLVFLGFPGNSAGKEFTCSAGDLGSIPRLGRCPGGWNSYPLQYSGLENSVDFIVHAVAKSRT